MVDYGVLPALILNLGSLLTYGVYYVIYYAQPEIVSGISTGAVRAATDILIFIVEWVFAISVITLYRSAGLSINQMIAPRCDIDRFRWLPATILFASWKLLFALYLLRKRYMLRTFAANQPVFFAISLTLIGFVLLLSMSGIAFTNLRQRYGDVAMTMMRLAVTTVLLLLAWRMGWLKGLAAGRSRTAQHEAVESVISRTCDWPWAYPEFNM